MLKSLSGRFFILTLVFVMAAEVMIFVPSVARFREDYLLLRLEKAQIAAFALLATDMVSEEVEKELLENAGVYNVILRRDEARQLVLSSEIPEDVTHMFDMRNTNAWILIRDAMAQLFWPNGSVARVLGDPQQGGGDFIEVTINTEPLRAAMFDYGMRIFILSAVISCITAMLLFFAVQRVLVRPIRGVIEHMQSYAEAPEDARRIIDPSSKVTELREAEDALHLMQTQLSQSLRQKERLAQLGGAVARVSHDLRNMLTTATLFTDRIERSEDPVVTRLAPKLLNALTRAVSLCEGTLAFGSTAELAPELIVFNFSELIEEVVEAERASVGDAPVVIDTDISDGFELRADPEHMYRIIGNLVRNARQAIQASGQDGRIVVGAVALDDMCVITVDDNGPGLPAKAQDKLFKPFEGGVRKGGTGLGLAIVAELVRGHGGRIRLLKSDETGTSFEIYLPQTQLTKAKKRG